MITREIEKEIKQEHKVILNFTLRQSVCVLVALVCSLCIALFMDMDFSISLYPCLVIGALCFAFGWIKQDGVPMEQILMKRLQTTLYENGTRTYKTKNRYVTMFNREYDRRQAMDRKDRKVKQCIRKENRRRKKARKHSLIKGIR